MERVAAWLLFAAMLTETFGLTWDIQWHTDVGPDTFFTAPHLVVYIAIAMAGLTSLGVVLYRTFGRPDTTVRSVDVLGTFRAPLPFLVSGLGAAGTLLYGLSDLWWHTVYGFDATPTSPPHVAMSLCGLITVAGGTMAFASMRGTRSGRVGFGLYVGVGCYYNIFLLLSTPKLPFVAELPLAVTLQCVFALVLVAAVTRSPGVVVLAGLSCAAAQAVTWFVTPVVTRSYADAIGLPLRDYVDGTSLYAAISPIAMPVIAVLVAGVLLVGRRFSSPKAVVPTAGALAGAALSAGYLLQLGGLDVPTIAVSAVLGAGFAWIGWRVSAPLRTLVEA